MDGDRLRSIQAPLKDRYRAEPATARITLHAAGELGSEAISCSVQTGRALVKAGLHEFSGGDGTLACSGDMLLQALVACAGVTLESVATNRGIAVSGWVRAEGDLDFRGTMGISRDAPVGFTAIRVLFDIQSDASAAALDEVLAVTQRYCVVYQTLAQPPALTMTRQVAEESRPA